MSVASNSSDRPLCTRSLWWDVSARDRGVTILWSWDMETK